MGRPEAQRREGTYPKARAGEVQSDLRTGWTRNHYFFLLITGPGEPEAKGVEQLVVSSFLQACLSVPHVAGATRT